MALRHAVRAAFTAALVALVGCDAGERNPPPPPDTAAVAASVPEPATRPVTASDGSRDAPSDTSPVVPAPEAADTDADAAATVVRDYYAAIDARDYRNAYALWGGDTAGSGRSYEEFAAGFAGTERVKVEVGRPGRMGAAAGSRYLEIPVVVHAVGRDGARQRFEGTYTLRRSVVDGATAAQRRWHLYRASMRRVR